MSTSSSLLDLPPELLQKALLCTFIVDPVAERSLLLSNHYLNNSIKPVVRRSAEEYAKDHHGEVVVAVFSAAPSQNPLHEWLPQLAKVTGRIDSVLNHSRTKVDQYQQATEQQRLATAPTQPSLNVDSCMSTLKLGLYLLEAIHFHRQSSPINVRKALKSLSTYGLLVLRMTSILVAFAFLDDIGIIVDGPPSRDPVVELPQDSPSVVRAVETELTSFGCQAFLDIIKPREFHPHCITRTWVNGKGWTCKHQGVREANAKIEAARGEAAYKFKSALKLVRMNQQALKTDLISTRIQESLEESEPIPAGGMDDVRRLQMLVVAEVGDKSELEIMKEIKAVIGIWKT